jgi:hypothetical protein
MTELGICAPSHVREQGVGHVMVNAPASSWQVARIA